MENMNYIGSTELRLNRIEVFSFSGGAVPFYHITFFNGDESIVVGGTFTTMRVADNKPEDLVFESRNSNYFLIDLFHYFAEGKSLTDYNFAKRMKKKVADSGKIDSRVLVDLYGNDEVLNFALGASDYLYIKDEDGKIGLMFDEIQATDMGIFDKEE